MSILGKLQSTGEKMQNNENQNNERINSGLEWLYCRLLNRFFKFNFKFI
jgi:hypothetical protein